MRSRKELEAKSAVIGRVVVVSCRRFTTKARRHKDSGFRFKSHTRNRPFAALPPDVRKGSALPTGPSQPNTQWRGSASPLCRTTMVCLTEGRRPSAHQAAKPHAQVWQATLLIKLKGAKTAACKRID